MMIYYLLIISLLILGYYLCEFKKSDKNILIFLGISSILLIAISTLRYSIGFDYFSYDSLFKKISMLNFKEITTQYKNLFLIYAYMNKLVSLMGGNYISFLLIVNTIITTIIMWFIYNYSKMAWISIFIYITFQFFAHSMNLFRQSIAATLFLIAYPLILKRKFILYTILILFISSIHMSALILIPLYFLINIRFNYKSMIMITFIAFLIYIFDEQIFNIIINHIHPNFARYKDLFYWQGNSVKYIILPSLYFLCTLLFKAKLNQNQSNILINTSFYTFIIYIYITKHFIIERFSIYVFLFSIILIPEIINSFESNKVYKNLAIAITLIIGINYFMFAVNEGFHHVYPYISIFQKP